MIVDRSGDAEDLLTPVQVARHFRVATVTVQKWCERGLLPCIRVNVTDQHAGTRLIRRSDVDAFSPPRRGRRPHPCNLPETQSPASAEQDSTLAPAATSLPVWTPPQPVRLNPSAYDALFHEQRGACAYCEQPEREMDPATKQLLPLSFYYNALPSGRVIRRLVCKLCNIALTCLRDSGRTITRMYHDFYEGAPERVDARFVR